MQFIDPGHPGFIDAWRRLIRISVVVGLLGVCGLVAVFAMSGLGRYLISDLAIEVGQPRIAVPILRGIIERDPDERYAPYWSLAHAYHDLGKEEDAMSTIAEATRLFPRDPRPHRVRCEFGIEYERAAEVIDSCVAFAELDPGSSRPLLLVARARRQIGDIEGAIQAYRALQERCEEGTASGRNCRRSRRELATLEAPSPF